MLLQGRPAPVWTTLLKVSCFPHFIGVLTSPHAIEAPAGAATSWSWKPGPCANAMEGVISLTQVSTYAWFW
jgi:hypothetical protein